MNFGISTGTFYPFLPTLPAIEQVAEAGFRFVEVVLQGIDEHNLTFASHVSRLCAKLSLNVSSLHPRAEFFQEIIIQITTNCSKRR